MSNIFAGGYRLGGRPNSGARKIARVAYHRGHFKNPMTDAEMEEKFRQTGIRM